MNIVVKASAEPATLLDELITKEVGTTAPPNSTYQVLNSEFFFLQIFVGRPTYARVWHVAFFIVGTKRRTVAHTCPVVPKMP